MAAPSIAIDGAQVYGSYSVVVSGVTFIFDDITIDRAVEKASDMTIYGLPNRARYTAGPATGTATLQIPASLALPQFGNTFTATFDANYGSETFVVMPVPFVASNNPGEIRKVSIRFEKVYNSITTIA